MLAIRFRLRCPVPAGRFVAIAIAVGVGFSWAAWRAEWRLAEHLPMQWEQRDVEVVGVVAELPQPLDRAVRFVFDVETSEAPVPARIQLSWYPPRRGEGVVPELRAGERWRLTVRLRRPHGFANPHGFDYEAWLLERNVRATGYVRESESNERLATFVPRPMPAVHRVRGLVRERFAEHLAERKHAGVLIALAIGDQRAIGREHWEIFRRTAVAHLVSISGLHVSLVALLGAGVVGWAWRRTPWLALRVPTRKAAAGAGLLAATLYALLAGLGIPTQRALLMLGVAAAALMSGRETSGSRVLALALFVVLVFDPWAVLSSGFWLSFAAVGIILFVVGGRRRNVDGWRAAVRIQLAITLATAPALLVLFNAFSLVAPVANAVAIPMVSFLITPLTLAAIVVPHPALLELAHWLTHWMMQWLEWLSSQPFALWEQASVPAMLVLVAVVGVAWLLLPRGTPARHAALLAALPMLLWVPDRPGEGSFRLAVLDVGQGLAVHVQTAAHDLVYDTGPPYGPEADAGSRVLLPYLAGSGVRRIDRIVVSHGDSDHVGGAASLMRGVPVGDLLHGLDAGHDLLQGVSERACAAGETWHWDGVVFEVLHPSPDEPAFPKPNDRSCVLRIAAAGGSVLLTGDIEASAERSLVSRAGDRIASTLVVAPHHGSRTSSSAALVDSVRADHVVHAVGNLNPFRHPHPAVWARWDGAGARNWRTDSQGAILVEVGQEGLHIASQRARAPRYWHGR